MALSVDQILLGTVFLMVSALIMYQDKDSEAYQPPERTNTQDVEVPECVDHNMHCPRWADMGYCQRNHTEMLRACPLSCDSCDDQNYSSESVGCPKKYPTCQDCKDSSPHCAFWSTNGQCKSHPGYMVINCPKSCKYCHLQSNYSLRCPMSDAYMADYRAFRGPGDLNRFFESIVSYYEWQKNSVSWKLEILSRDPWILLFDDFFDEVEARGIIDAAGEFERSTDVGQADETGHFSKITSTSRTSKNAWCQQRCWNAPLVQQVMIRVENLLNISLENTESLQILEYTKGQYYKTHHDFIANQVQMSCGPRILTWFMYLSDVEEGGATNFPRLGIKATPKVGRVILWPSVLDEDATKIDSRTYHEAQAVVKGVKYGANAWYHLYNFQEPNLWTCTG